MVNFDSKKKTKLSLRREGKEKEIRWETEAKNQGGEKITNPNPTIVISVLPLCHTPAPSPLGKSKYQTVEVHHH